MDTDKGRLDAQRGEVRADSESDANQRKRVVIYLTRHSRTTGNEMHLMQGWCDFPLSVEGVRIARQFGRGLKACGIRFGAAYCGNLTRHYDTARIALQYSGNSGVVIRVDPDLREDNFGSFEGRPVVETRRMVLERLNCCDAAEANVKFGDDFIVHWQDALHDLDLENALHTDLTDEDRAESVAEIRARMVPAIIRIAQETERRGGGNVLVVSSGSVISQFLRAVAPAAGVPNQENTAVTKVIYVDGELAIVGEPGSMEYYEHGAQ